MNVVKAFADGAESTPAAWRRRQTQTLENIILDNEPRVSVREPAKKGLACL